MQDTRESHGRRPESYGVLECKNMEATLAETFGDGAGDRIWIGKD